MRFFFLLFITIPIAEIWVLLEVSSKIGVLNTIGLVFLTAVVGITLLKRQGLNTLLRLNQRIEQGQLPAAEIFEGVVLAIGGALLLTPGFITDVLGFACILPFSRNVVVAELLKRGVLMASYGHSSTFSSPTNSTVFEQSDLNSNIKNSYAEDTDVGHIGAGKHRPDIIDGEYRRED